MNKERCSYQKIPRILGALCNGTGEKKTEMYFWLHYTQQDLHQKNQWEGWLTIQNGCHMKQFQEVHFGGQTHIQGQNKAVS